MDPIAPRPLPATPAPPPPAAPAPPSDPVDTVAPGDVIDLDAAIRALSRARLVPDGETATVWELATHHYDSRAYPSAAGHLYEGGNDGTLRRLNADGTVAWEKRAGDNALSVTPAVAPDGTAFVSRVVSVEAYAPDGTRLWHNPISDSLSLRCSAGPDGHCYVYDGTRLLALDGRTGKELWHKRMQSAWVDDPPVVGKGRCGFPLTDAPRGSLRAKSSRPSAGTDIANPFTSGSGSTGPSNRSATTSARTPGGSDTMTGTWDRVLTESIAADCATGHSPDGEPDVNVCQRGTSERSPPPRDPRHALVHS